MSKAQQAAEERWPSYPTVGFSGAEDRQAAFLAGVAWALPEVPDPAVIEAMAKGMYSEALPGRSWDWRPEEVKQHWRRYARAAYAALRGAMQ